MLKILEKDRFFLDKDKNPLIGFIGEEFDFARKLQEFNSLASMQRYCERENIVINWDELLTNYYSQKTPLWDEFFNIIINDDYFSELYRKLAEKKPLKTSSLHASILLLLENNPNNFRLIYQEFYNNAQPNEVKKWVSIAEKCYLPYAFQMMIKNPN